MSDQQNISENEPVDMIVFLKESKVGLVRRFDQAVAANIALLKQADIERDNSLKLKGAIEQMDKLIENIEKQIQASDGQKIEKAVEDGTI